MSKKKTPPKFGPLWLCGNKTLLTVWIKPFVASVSHLVTVALPIRIWWSPLLAICWVWCDRVLTKLLNPHVCGPMPLQHRISKRKQKKSEIYIAMQRKTIDWPVRMWFFSTTAAFSLSSISSFRSAALTEEKASLSGARKVTSWPSCFNILSISVPSMIFFKVVYFSSLLTMSKMLLVGGTITLLISWMTDPQDFSSKLIKRAQFTVALLMMFVKIGTCKLLQLL